MPSMMKAPHSKGANCAMCDGGKCKMAKGGFATQQPDVPHGKGVHHADLGEKRGSSYVGQLVRDKAPKRHIEEEHGEALKELRSNPRPTSGKAGFAEGGEVDADGDEELSHGLGKELMGAFEAKDHKKLMSSLEACVLHCMSKNDGDEDDV